MSLPEDESPLMFSDPARAATVFYLTLALIAPKLRRHSEWFERDEGYPVPEDLAQSLAIVERTLALVQRKDIGTAQPKEAA